MAKIKVIIKRPDEEFGHVCNISNSLENLQKTVGGYIEAVPLTDEIVIICNEDGKLKGLEPNFHLPYDTIVGTVIICGVNGDEFSDIPEGFFTTWKEVVRWIRLRGWGN